MRRLLNWLSKRFPEQLVVSKEEYNQLREELGAYNRIVQGVGQLHERLAVLEKQVQNLNNAQGFISTGKGSFKLER
jgi:hypothetical protein